MSGWTGITPIEKTPPGPIGKKGRRCLSVGLTLTFLALITSGACAVENEKIIGLFYTADKAFAAGLWGRSLLYYTIIIDLDPDNTIAYHKRGQAHVRIGEFEKALEDFYAVARRNPSSKQAKLAILACTIKTKEYEKALTLAEGLLVQGYPKDQVLAAKAEIFFLTGDIEKAKQIMDEVLKINPGYLTGLINRPDSNNHDPRFLNTFSFSEEKPLQVLFIGDSMAGGSIYYRTLSYQKNYKAVNFTFHYKTSSGLTRPDFYNWPYEVNKYLAENAYRVIFVLMGTNDAQNCAAGGRVYVYGTEDWFTMYKMRVESFLAILESHAEHVFWIGLPPMGRPGFNERMESLNAIFEEVCKGRNVSRFVPTKPLYVDENGNYCKTITINGVKRTARIGDGVHMTMDGVLPLLDKIFSLITERYFIQAIAK